MNGGGPALRAIPCKCGMPTVRKQGHQWLCPKHYRFGQMKANAKRHGKMVPTDHHLEMMADTQLLCADCHVQMNWLGVQGRATVATLQHYRDGTMALVCRSCNTRHAFMPGDSYRDTPKDHKYCPHCKTVKPFTDYAKDNGRSGQMKLKSWCKPCSTETVLKWEGTNRESYNRKQREGRARRASS